MRTASEMLRQAREEKGLSLAAAERETKIKKIYLEKIEKGHYDALPSESYAQGFVKNYAKFLGISENIIVPIYKREYDSTKHVPIIPEFRKKQHVFRRRNLFSGRGLGFLAVVVLVVGYLFFQYSSLIFAPGIEISKPVENQTISSNVIEVRGKTDPYATVEINGDEVYVALDGTFKKSVYGFSGNNKIKVVAKNRYGKQTEKMINVRVE